MNNESHETTEFNKKLVETEKKVEKPSLDGEETKLQDSPRAVPANTPESETETTLTPAMQKMLEERVGTTSNIYLSPNLTAQLATPISENKDGNDMIRAKLDNLEKEREEVQYFCKAATINTLRRRQRSSWWKEHSENPNVGQNERNKCCNFLSYRT